MNADLKFVSVVSAGLLAAALSCGAVLAQQANEANPPKTESHSSSVVEHENVNTTGVHHYTNKAEEAEDALIITRIKTALATDGIGNGHPLAVDCDHGVAHLTGVVSSAEDAQHAAQVAAAVPGVVGVENKLTWK